MVIVLLVTVAVPDAKTKAMSFPALVTVAVTAVAGSNSNPDGAFNTMVPSPISPVAASATAGPVNVVQSVLGAAVSAEMAVPPLAGVTVALSVNVTFAFMPESTPTAV